MVILWSQKGRQWIYYFSSRKLKQYFFFLEPPQIIPFTFGKLVTDAGAFAQLTCAVSHGDMPITITWSLKGQELNSGPSIVTTMVGTRTSMLIISSVDYSHVGEYTCRASNPAGSVTHSANLVVNGNFGQETGTGKYFTT